MNKYKVLTLNYDFGILKDVIHPTVLKVDDEDSFVLVDCGYPKSIKLLEEALAEISLNLENCSGILITHHDYDHMGSLGDLIERFPKLNIYSSSVEKAYVEGLRTSLRLEQARRLYTTMPEEEKSFAEKMQKVLAEVRPGKVTRALRPRDVLPWAGGAEIIELYGHTPGHIGVYLKESKTLIAGDGLALEDGVLNIANPELCLNLKQAVESIGKLANYSIETIICYHGGIATNDIKTQLQGIVDRFNSGDLL